MYKLRAFLAAILSWLLISDFWQILEKSMYGEVKPDEADSVISLIILALFYFLYTNVMEKRELKEKLDKKADVINVNIVESQNE